MILQGLVDMAFEVLSQWPIVRLGQTLPPLDLEPPTKLRDFVSTALFLAF